MWLRILMLAPLWFSMLAAAQVASIDLRAYGFRPTHNAAYRPEFNTSAVAYLTDGSLVVGFRRSAEVMGKSSPQGRNLRPVRLLRFDPQSGKLLAQADTMVERGLTAAFFTSAPGNDLLVLGTSKFVLLDSALREIATFAVPEHAARIDLADGARSFAVGVRDGEKEQFSVIELPGFRMTEHFELDAGAPLALLSDGFASIRGENGENDVLVITHEPDGKKRITKLPNTDLGCRPIFGKVPDNHILLDACSRFWVFDEHAERVIRGDVGADDDLVSIASSAASARFALITIEGFSRGPIDQQRIYGESFRAIVYDADSGAKLRTVKVKPMPKLGGAFALSPDGKTLAVLKDGEVDQVAVDVAKHK